MVDILLYRRQPLRSTGARASNYRNAHYKVSTQPGRKKKYSVVIVYDPLPVAEGGLRSGAEFQVEDWKRTLSEKTIAENTIVQVLPSSSVGNHKPNWLPGYYRCVTLRVVLPDDSTFYAPCGGKAYMDMIQLNTIDDYRRVVHSQRERRNGKPKLV